MFKPYRFVWNKEQKYCSVTCASGGFDATISDGAGMVLEALSEDPGYFKQALVDHTDFVTRAISYGWIDSKGHLQGTFTRVDGGPHLKRLQMELTVHCNLKCTYCYSESGPTKKSALSLEQIVDVLTQARDLGLIWIDFTGGEFFMYRHWQEALKVARALGLIVTLHTNGTTLNERNLAAVQEAGVRCLQISLDSHIPAVHDRMRGVPGALEKTLNGIRLAKELKLPVRVVIMVHQGNKDYIEDTLKFFREDLVVPIMIDRIISAGAELDAKVGLPTKEYYELISPLLTRNIVSTRICENKGAPKHENVEPHCGVAQSFIYMTADGEFALCPTMTSRDRPFFTGPSIHDMDIKTAWLDSDYFNQYRYTNCRNIGVCPAAKQCGGGCRSNAYFETGEIDSPDVFNCNMNKNPEPQFVDFLQRYEQGVFGVV